MSQLLSYGIGIVIGFVLAVLWGRLTFHRREWKKLRDAQRRTTGYHPEPGEKPLSAGHQPSPGRTGKIVPPRPGRTKRPFIG